MTMIPSVKPNGWEDDWGSNDDKKIQLAFWTLASEAFAEVATGKVYAFLPDGEGSANTWDKRSLWNNELEILQASDGVTSIVRINENPPHTQSAMKGSC
jgi:hypothetical protein